MAHRLAVLVGGLVAVVGLGALPGCWYNTTGRSAAAVGDIYIPFFQDDTAGDRAVNLGVRLTDRVVREFQQDRSIRVYQAAAERSQAQKELLGIVKNFAEGVVTRDPTERGEEYRVRIIVAITYKDVHTDAVLWQDGSVFGEGSYLLSEGEPGFERALQDCIDRVIEKIVDKTIKAW